MFELLLVAYSLLLVSTLPAFAYLDPGTGSLVLQMLVAGALTAAASIRFFWSRVKGFARRLFGARLGAKSPPAGGP